MTSHVADALHHAIAERPGVDGADPWVQFVDRTVLTRRELLIAGQRVAAGFRELGVSRGDRVALMVSNRPEFLQSCLACAMLGAIAVPVNTAFRGDVFSYLLGQIEPRILVLEKAYLEVCSRACAQAGLALAPVLCVVEDGEGCNAHVSFDQLLAGDVLKAIPRTDPWDPALIMYTSGTTGASKGVVWTHRTVVRVAQSARENLEYTCEDVVHTSLPLFHGNALALSVFGALIAGASVVVGSRFSASGFWAEVVESNATVTSLLGSMAQILWRQQPSELERAHRLRVALVIPSPPGGQYEDFERRFRLRMTEAYGLSDIGMLLWTPPGERMPGSCGKAARGWELQIVDQHDQAVPSGSVGELVARPLEPFLAPTGYWGLPEATVESRRNLWLHTGDLMHADCDGWHYFVDRRKDAIRRRGENVSSFEVEQVLLAHSAVAECAAYPVPSELMEEEVMVAVCFEEGTHTEFSELVDHCVERLPYFAVPRYFRVMKALPRTPTEKIRKADLRVAGVTVDTWDREKDGHASGR